MINELAALVGKENVSAREADKLAYSSDASLIRGRAKLVIWPKNAGQIQKIISHARRTHSNIVPRGAGTGLAGAAVPENSIVLDISKMNKILKLNLKERFVVIEPGIVLSNLNKYLEHFNLFFPIMPASHKVATLGGMISTNAAGERTIKYGRTAEWVLELEVIDGKGNTRYLKTKEDVRAFCGAEGILGIITKAKLALTQPIRERSITLLKFNKAGELIKAAKEHCSVGDVIAIEFFDKESAKLSGLEEKHHLFVEFESDKGEIKDPEEVERIWALRERLGPMLSSAGFIIMEDPKVSLEKAEEFLEWLAQHNIPSFGHIGVEIFHPRFKQSQTNLIIKMFELVKKLNGRVSGEHGIGTAKKRFADKEFVSQIRKVKAKYDPESVLNKGKII